MTSVPEVEVGPDHRGIAAAKSAHPTERGHFRDGIIVHAEVAQRRDVFPGAVRKACLNAQLTGFTRLGERKLRRRNCDLCNLTISFQPPSAARDPFLEQAILPGVAAEAHAAAVVHLAGRLEQEQAPLGIDRIDATTERLAGEGKVVLVRIVTE